MIKDFAQRVIESFSPKQLCGICLVVSFAAVSYGAKIFAREPDVESLRADLAAIRIDQVQKEVMDLRIRQCEAIKAGQSARWFALRLNESMVKYRSLVGDYPELPRCDEL